jgi:signal recognition particle subunit SRP54
MPQPDANAAGGQGLSGLPGLPGLGSGGDAKPNPLSGLGLPGFNPFKK